MNRTVISILSVVMAWSAIERGLAQETNLLANPSFEQGAVGAAPPEWGLYNKGEGKKALIIAAGGHSGKQEAQLSKEAPVELLYTAQYVSAPLKIGEVYRFTGWLKANAPADVLVEFSTMTGGNLNDDSYKNVKVGTEWEPFEVLLRVKNGQPTKLRAMVQLATSGVTVSFDDAALVKLPIVLKPGQALEFGHTPADFHRLVEPTDEVVSPHITWSKPSAAGPLRVLFLTHLEAMREVVEMRERFDFSINVFSTQTIDEFAATPAVVNNGGSHDWTQEAREARLHELLAHDYDVIVIGNIRWDILPAWARTAILAKVQAGTGLFGFIRGGVDDALRAALNKEAAVDPRTALSAFPYIGLPAFRSAGDFAYFTSDNIRFGQYGKGRLAVLLVRPPSGSGANFEGQGILGGGGGIRVPIRQAVTPEIVDPFPGIYMVHYEYYLALAGQLMDWAAGRTPAVRVAEPAFNTQHIRREEPESIPVVLESQEDRQVMVEYVIRDSDSGRVWLQERKPVTLHKGHNDFEIPASELPGSNYFADVWVKDGDKTIDFGSLFINVTSRNAIQRVDLANESFGKSDSIAGTVTLEGAKSGQVLQIAQIDNYSREVIRKNLPTREGIDLYQFSLPPGTPLSVLQTIEARLLDGATILDLKRSMFTYRDIYPPDDIRCLADLNTGVEDSDSYLYVTLAKAMHKNGIDSWITESGDNILSYEELKDTPYYKFTRHPVRVDAKGHTMGAALLGNMWNVVTILDQIDTGYDFFINPQGYVIETSPRGVERKPSLTNAGYRRRTDDFYASVARDTRKFAIRDYALGDECTFMGHDSDASFDDASILDFQNYIHDHYGTIQRLNDEYGTSYTHWNEVIPIPYDQAKKEGKIPIWIDHRRHTEAVWAGYYARALQAITREVPGARAGYEGSGDSSHAQNDVIGGAEDYYLLAKSMTLDGMYYFPLQLDCVRDFSAPGTMIGGGWFGGYPAIWRAAREKITQGWWVWNSFLRGANSVWIFTGCNVQSDGDFAVMPPDFSPTDAFRSTSAEIRLAKSGIGKLLMSSERSDDGIAVLYSPSSMLLTAFDSGMPARWDSVCAASHILIESGFQYRMVASQQLEEGILRQHKFRMLYLPFCQALSPKEVEEIQAFTKAGGVVLADLRPGVADAHGKPYAQGSLDDLFGVKQDTKQASPLKASVQIMEQPDKLGSSLSSARTDASLRVTSGKAYGKAGDAAAVVVNSYGKGAGVLLNVALCDYMVGDLMYAPEFGTEEKAAATRQLIQGVLAMQHITPAMAIEPYVPGIHAFRFKTGEEHVLGLMWDPAGYLPGTLWSDTDKQSIIAMQSKKVTLDLGSPCYVYDMRTGTYLGQQQKIERTLSPGTVDLLTALPYKIEGVNLEVDRSVAAQGQPVDYSVSLNARPTPGSSAVHIFHIEFTDPDGNVADQYSLNTKASGGIYHGAFMTSLNEKPGSWKIVVKDIQSGVTGTATFQIKAVAE